LRIRTRWPRWPRWPRCLSRDSHLAPTERALCVHVHCRTWVRLANRGTPPSPPRKPSRRHPRALGLTTTLFFCLLTTTTLGKLVCSIQSHVGDLAVFPTRRGQFLARTGFSVSTTPHPTGRPRERVLQYKTPWHGRHYQ
jgi:hypothetical protein